jgi:site-specific DNA recombinase
MQNRAPKPMSVLSRTCVIYARVSSKEQEHEGYSIQAQLTLLRDYAAQEKLQILQEFVDVETAKVAGRPSFNAMLAYLKKQSTCHTLLVEKTDRLYRNLKDWVTIDDFGLEIHFPKENVIIGPESRSSEKFLHGIKVLMAKNYVENLGEEASKGMREKAKSGIWPSVAPMGYQNVQGPDGKRTITPHPVQGPVIRQIFEWFETGDYTLKTIAEKIRNEGLPFGTRQVNVSSLHVVLRNRTYSGEFEWKGTMYQGTYEALVSRDTWERVQDLLDARQESRHRKMIHDFTYSGLVRCGHCGCFLVGELKKGRYVYYHCTGNKGKCDEPYTREEILHREFTAILKKLAIPDSVLKWLDHELEFSVEQDERIQQRTIKSWQEEWDRMQARLDAMYEDKLDGRISSEQFDRKAKETRSKQQALRAKMSQHQTGSTDLRAGFNMMRLTSIACREFERRNSREQRKLLELVIDGASWRGARLESTLHEPFRTLACSNSGSETKSGGKGASKPQLSDWLPGMDSNHDSRLQRPLSYH